MIGSFWDRQKPVLRLRSAPSLHAPAARSARSCRYAALLALVGAVAGARTLSAAELSTAPDLSGAGAWGSRTSSKPPSTPAPPADAQGEKREPARNGWDAGTSGPTTGTPSIAAPADTASVTTDLGAGLPGLGGFHTSTPAPTKNPRDVARATLPGLPNAGTSSLLNGSRWGRAADGTTSLQPMLAERESLQAEIGLRLLTPSSEAVTLVGETVFLAQRLQAERDDVTTDLTANQAKLMALETAARTGAWPAEVEQYAGVDPAYRAVLQRIAALDARLQALSDARTADPQQIADLTRQRDLETGRAEAAAADARLAGANALQAVLQRQLKTQVDRLSFLDNQLASFSDSTRTDAQRLRAQQARQAELWARLVQLDQQIAAARR